MKYVCVGHATYDIVLPLSEYPIENKRNRTTNKIECGGGPAATAAYLLAKWGVNSTYIGTVGNDYYGKNIIREFNNIGVNTEYIEKLNGYSTDVSYIIANEKNGSRTLITSKDHNIDKLSEEIDIEADFILVDGEHFKTAEEIIMKNPNAISVLDAGHVNDKTNELGKIVNYIICSKDYAEEFTNKRIDVSDMNNLIAIYEELKIYFKTNIIITLGEDGSFTKINDYIIIPSIKVNAVDSTGAGDIFHGAFMYFLAKNYSLREAIKYASVAGALSTEKIGSRFAIPDVSEVLGSNDEIEYL